MEASRDDFIIAIRSAFLKKGTKQRFSLIALIFFSLLLLILGRFNFKAIDYVKIGLKETVYRSSFIVSVPENYIKDIYQKISLSQNPSNVTNKDNKLQCVKTTKID